jgi:Ca2+-transporting ATPase
MTNLPAHALMTTDVAAAFAVDPQRGLAEGEAKRRLVHFGRNISHRHRAQAFLDAIASLVSARPPRMARVLCDGAETLVRASDVVPGDVIVVEPDDDVPADARLVDTSTLFVDEAHLTGEHTPIRKSAEAVAMDAALAERRSMLYLGTRVVRGHATAVVTATGDSTEIAKLSHLVKAEENHGSSLASFLHRPN